MRRLSSVVLVASLCVAGTGAAFAVGIAAPTDLPAQQPAPVAHPYDTTADAHAQVDAAFADAKRTGRDVLIDFGANWCPDCRMLAGVFDMPQVKAWKDSNFASVSVNVDRFNVNMDIPARYGVKVKSIPTVLILTPDGKLLNADGTLALGNARTMSPAAAVDLIASWEQRKG
ncbi:thioredoxin family protein [Lichenicola sp.]|uniref:thioredoxin family protein n=1 Tax=Lichenicola sp. TaxID=2804529 RepID=UPI003B007F4B